MIMGIIMGEKFSLYVLTTKVSDKFVSHGETGDQVKKNHVIVQSNNPYFVMCIIIWSLTLYLVP